VWDSSCSTACGGRIATFLSWLVILTASSHSWGRLHVDKLVRNSPPFVEYEGSLTRNWTPSWARLIQTTPSHLFCYGATSSYPSVCAVSFLQCLRPNRCTRMIMQSECTTIRHVPKHFHHFSSAFGLINFCPVSLYCANGRQHPSHYPWWSLGCLCDQPPCLVRWERFRHVTLQHRSSIKVMYVTMYVCMYGADHYSVLD
jgi:hypothetical protein